MLKKIVLFTLLLTSVFACSDDTPEIAEAVGIMQNAPTNFEDCGWVINVDGNYFKPTKLPSLMEIEGLQVYFTYEDLNQQESCQSMDLSLARIRLIQIRER